jgi:acyl dehydratase
MERLARRSGLKPGRSGCCNLGKEMARGDGKNMEYRMRGKTFDEVNVGDQFRTAARTITEADVVNFAGLSGDYHPEHMNEEFARQGMMGGRIAHGLLILSIATGQLNQTGMFEGTTIAVMEMKARFIHAVRFGDTITTVASITGKNETKKPDRGVVTLRASVLNQHDNTVLEAESPVMLYRKGYAPG